MLDRLIAPVFITFAINLFFSEETLSVNLDAVSNSSIFTPLQLSDGESRRTLAVLEKFEIELSLPSGKSITSSC